MAQHLVLTCDHPIPQGGTCGKEVPSNASTKVSVDGVFHQVDLCADHREMLFTLIAPLTQIWRPYAPPSPANVRKVLRDHSGATFTVADVRAWLQAEGREVSYTGRVPEALVEEYRSAHP